jgi:hypothetical protein
MPIEFEFTATPKLENDALRYLLWRRGGPIGPIAIILFPIVLAIAAAGLPISSKAFRYRCTQEQRLRRLVLNCRLPVERAVELASSFRRSRWRGR